MQQLSPSRVAATLKAALTCWKTGCDSFDARAMLDLATCGGRIEALSAAEIDSLITVIDQATLEHDSAGSIDEPTHMTHYAGFLRFEGKRIDFGFSAPMGAGEAEVADAALDELAEHVELSILPIGDYVVSKVAP